MPVARCRFLLASYQRRAYGSSVGAIRARRSFVQRSGVVFLVWLLSARGNVAVLRILLESVVMVVTAR